MFDWTRSWCVAALAGVTLALAGCGASVRPGDGGYEGGHPMEAGVDGDLEGGSEAGAYCTAPNGQRIAVGTQAYYDGCNWCDCLASGELRCTARLCPEGGVDGGTCQGLAGDEIPGGESRQYGACTTCYCPPGGGSAACTGGFCPDGGDAMPPPPPPWCTAPDGSPLPVGEAWRDACRVCVCVSPGNTQCRVVPGCASDGGDVTPPPPECIAPDGTPLPVGASWRGLCEQCVCLSGGLACSGTGDCPTDGGDVTPPPPPVCFGAGDCPSGTVCTGALACGSPGRCVSTSACLGPAAQFCLCDGTTAFGSAACPPVNARSVGACAAPGTCTSSAQCGFGQACLGPLGCGVPWTCQSLGSCLPADTTYCGCDGLTHYAGTVCDLTQARSLGPCPSADAGVCSYPSYFDPTGNCHGPDGRPQSPSCCAVDAGGPVDASVDASGGRDCDFRTARCPVPAPPCPPAYAAEVDPATACWTGACVPFATCAPIACNPRLSVRQCPTGAFCNPATFTCAAGPVPL